MIGRHNINILPISGRLQGQQTIQDRLYTPSPYHINAVLIFKFGKQKYLYIHGYTTQLWKCCIFSHQKILVVGQYPPWSYHTGKLMVGRRSTFLLGPCHVFRCELLVSGRVLGSFHIPDISLKYEDKEKSFPEKKLVVNKNPAPFNDLSYFRYNLDDLQPIGSI